jgi:Cu+-exporting ATPase
MATDPVCGMKVKEADDNFEEYDGKKYYFCRDECRNSFKKNPIKYTRR